MLCPSEFFRLLQMQGIDFFAGVPDSLLKDFCAYVTDHAAADHHFICANEGSAVALACGYHLATGRTGLVYMQNSGLGNAVNPLLSLADPAVYGLPVLLLIGWRGEPGRNDEPQHVKQGKVTPELLRAMEIPFAFLPPEPNEAAGVVAQAVATMRERSAPFALIVREGTFAGYAIREQAGSKYVLTREEAIRTVLARLEADDIVVSTTGKASREIFEYRKALQQGHQNDFLTVGSMGHCSQIALGVSLNAPAMTVYCIDGDGAALMHLGGMATIGCKGPTNYRHIIMNNGAHESVGGQPTVGFEIDFCDIARACGYRGTFMAETVEGVSRAVDAMKTMCGPLLLEIRVSIGSRKDLGRPDVPPVENKRGFMATLGR